MTSVRTGTPAAGALLCLVSAAGFGAMAIFGKLAYEAGVSTLTLLLVRFATATVIFVLALRLGRPSPPVARRALIAGFALGAVGYSLQAGLFFGALQRLDASLLSLILYTYPAWVTIAAFALGRERPNARRLVALGLSSAGLVVVLAGAAGGDFDALGAVLGIGSSFAYTAYILTADGAALPPPIVLATLVCAGATLTFCLVGVASGKLDFGFEGDGWLWLALMAVVCTALPISTFFAGLRRVGPSTASILSTFEPVVTVVLAFLAFGEHLSLVQLGGAVLVLSAAVMLAAPARAPRAAPPT